MGESEEPPEPVEVEFSISMHCNACERKVAKVVSKIKGVEKFMTDMRNHKVVVMGRFKPEKVLKKLKKKTGKRVEIVIPEDGGEGEEGDENEDALHSDGDLLLNEDGDTVLVIERGEEEEEGGLCDEISAFDMFSDENANGCSIM